ncbi:flagellar basal body rod protein FlgG [Peribacillus asahii]|uniref:flagellar basal body rod protein FlgG n=1 Tax=Peribacillus asahii TaxID=228899 RepID=UPI00380CF35D
MLRSMYSGISGLKNFQTKLDVIGNNVANVNTFGFKKGRTTFSDQISQTIAGATAPGDTRGGVNAKQVGLGASLASIDTIATQGSMQNTGRTLDLAISGNGYFQVMDGDTPYYTRAGNFYLDQAGTIVNSEGLILGETAITIPQEAQSFSIGADGKVTYVDAEGELQEAGEIQLVTFANPEGLTKAGSNLFRVSGNSGEPEPKEPGVDGAGTVQSGFLEMSNVDLSEEFTEMIVAQRAFQSNTRIITTSDEILQELVNLKR